MSIIHRFANFCLEEITYPNKTESWHVQGRLKNKSNQTFKFEDFEFNAWHSHYVVYKLVPYSAIIDKTSVRNYCSQCSYRVRDSKWVYCPKCGNRI